ncbi:hypothetical protein EMIT0P100_40113 [Pseudomonas sp. IT-P100]
MSWPHREQARSHICFVFRPIGLYGHVYPRHARIHSVSDITSRVSVSRPRPYNGCLFRPMILRSW